MSKCLIVLDHSFRTNSLIIKFAASNFKEISIVYPSPWYYDERYKRLYKKNNTNFFRESINLFASKLKKKFNYNLKILKSKNPVAEIEKFCLKEKVDLILYDNPLFGDRLKFTGNIDFIEMDNDSYIPNCKKMTAKSRWTFWLKNKLHDSVVQPKLGSFTFYKCLGEEYILDKTLLDKTSKELNEVLQDLKQKIKNYSLNRNTRNGGTKLSKYLHHGIIDSRELTQVILNLYLKEDNNENYIPILRQLAFREIAIEKTRNKNISMFDNVKDLCVKLLDQKSVENILNTRFKPEYSKEQLFSANTNNEKLNLEIKSCIEKCYMPNRARMWFAGECYWGLGGGVESLEILISFFNKHCDDGQSPNNIINCVESLRLQYGKVMRLNEKRTFKLLEEYI